MTDTNELRWWRVKETATTHVDLRLTFTDDELEAAHLRPLDRAMLTEAGREDAPTVRSLMGLLVLLEAKEALAAKAETR